MDLLRAIVLGLHQIAFMQALDQTRPIGRCDPRTGGKTDHLGRIIRQRFATFDIKGVMHDPHWRVARWDIVNKEQQRLFAFDIESPGVLGAPVHAFFPGRVLHKFSGYERLDSLAVDSEGNVVVATLGTGCVTAVSPEGVVRAVVPVPEFDLMVTNVCFGGPDLRTAYITSSGLGRLYKTEWHCPGLPLNFLPIQ